MMPLRALFGWIVRHALLFALIVAALVVVAQFVVDPAERRRLDASIADLQAAEQTLRPEVVRLRARAVTSLDLSACNAGSAINRRLAALSRQRTAIAAARPRGFDVLRSPRSAIIADTRAQMSLALIDQETSHLRQLQALVPARDSLDGRIQALCSRVTRLDAAIAADAANIAALPGPLSPGRYVREGVTLRDLADVYADRQQTNRSLRVAAEAQLAAAQAMRRRIPPPRIDAAAIAAPLDRLAAATSAQQARLISTAEREARRWYARLGIGGLLWPAFAILIGIILTPLAIRSLFYWVLAPLATRRVPILLLNNQVPIPVPPARSSVSRAISLAPGQELLVRQGFLQSVAQAGAKATQWLLDAHHPFSSLASGLMFLTRIRGASADAVTVSATHDPFAEIAILSLPAGAAIVLQPRAIVGVVQPIDQPLRISSRWRLFSLNAWLTGQLRFLIFHGPAEIILAGARGVRIEAAVTGRSIRQDQLIGFSAGIAYGAGRTETFLPYLFGLEPLLKDRIAAGNGLLIAEEAPLSARAGSNRRRGLEGIVDALLKPLGI